MKTVDIGMGVLLYFLNLGAVAQLVRASDCRSEGCGFESHRPRFSDFCLVSTYACFLISFGG